MIFDYYYKCFNIRNSLVMLSIECTSRPENVPVISLKITNAENGL